jgi:putative inorganic carbon (HCO3(-)) transporter
LDSAGTHNSLPAKKELGWFYGIMFCFIAFSIVMLMKEQYWFAAVPLLAVIGYLAIFSLDTILFIVAFCTPLSIVLNDKSSGPALSIPSEPLLFGVLLIFMFKFIFEGRFDKRVLYHPVTIAIGFHIAWMFITSLTSSMPVVSFKHLLSQLWFIVPFYMLGTQLFRERINIKKFIWLYASALLFVVAYTIYRHADNGWTQKAAHWVMIPFYNDHTAYAAVLALFIPPLIAFARDKKSTVTARFLSGLLLFVFITAIILSYTRAAWLSLLIALAVYFVYAFRIKFYTVFVVMIAMTAAFLVLKTDIFMKLEKNRQDSATDFNKHIESISNISTDASNLERINRWNSALRMWEQKPFWGWGPGTYQFNYAPFQKSSEMTIISTNAGDMGNAHSEYIGPLSESGVLGMMGVIFIVITVLYRGTMVYSNAKNPNVRLITLGVLLGLITYFVHGVLNNFLDTDKLAVPYWAFIAMIVAMDVYHTDTSPDGGELLNNAEERKN